MGGKGLYIIPVLSMFWLPTLHAQGANTFPSSGNVGIGTTSPASPLTVSNTLAAGNIVNVLNPAGGEASVIYESSGQPSWVAGNGAWGLSGDYVIGGGTTWGPKFTMDPSGNIGIGTTSPLALFQVGAGGTTERVVIDSQRDNHGQLQIGNPASGAEASINFESGVSSFGDSATSQNGTSYVWGLGAGVWGIGGNKFALGNDGFGGPIFTVQSNGSVGIGTTSPGATLEVNGGVKLTTGSGGSITFADGTVQGTAYTGVSCGGDFAESVDVTGRRKRYEAGDLLVIDPKHPGEFQKAVQPYSTLVAGVYSTKPGYVGRRLTGPKSPDEVPLAMIGIVPTKVTTENGPIHTGDLLVASSTAGRAMKGTDRSRLTGAVVGKALGDLESGTGTIEVLVTLQ